MFVFLGKLDFSFELRLGKLCDLVGYNLQVRMIFLRAGETALWRDQDPTFTLPQHVADLVNGDVKWQHY